MKINSANRGFAQGTLVLMADGKTKPIEQIQSGDLVLSFDEYDADAPLEPMRVIDTFERIDNNVLQVKVGETILKVAQDQMFIGPHNDWKQVYNHSYVVDVNGNPVEYEVSKISTGKHRIYDITVEGNHSLIANGIRVHNSLGNSASDSKGDPSGSGPSKSGSGGNTSGRDPDKETKGAGSTRGGIGGGQAGNKSSGGGSKGKGSGSSSNQSRGGGGSGGGSQGGGGKAGGKSAGDSHAGDSANGGRGQGGQNNGVGPHNKNGTQKGMGNTPTVGYSGGFKKKKKKAKEEPDPKPSGSSVASKLLATIRGNMIIISEIVSALEPNELNSAKQSIQGTIDASYQFSHALISAVIASEVSSYDKAGLMQVAYDLIAALAELRHPFEEANINSSHKKIAIAILMVIDEHLDRGTLMLGHYLGDDTRGALDVTVDGNTTYEPGERPGTYARDRGGKYTPKAKVKSTPKHKIRAKKISSNGSRGLEGQA